MLMDLQIGGTTEFKVVRGSRIYVDAIQGATGAANYYDATNNLFRGSGGIQLQHDSALLKMGGSDDVVMARDAANTLALRNSTNAQTFNIYNTWTDASNYERAVIKWDTNVLKMGYEEAGSGAAFRSIELYCGANRIWVTDGTFVQYDRELYPTQNIYLSANKVLFIGTPGIYSGSGSPEGVTTAPTGSIYMNTAGGTDTTMYTKNSGAGNTGWVAVDNV